MSVRITLLGQVKGSSSPRLHYQQQQGVDTGGKVRRPQDLGSMQCGPSQICPICCQKINSPQTRLPGACSSALEGAHGSEPQLGTANLHLHRQPAPKTPALAGSWTCPLLSTHFIASPTANKREDLLPLSQQISGTNIPQDNLIFTTPRRYKQDNGASNIDKE